MTNYVVTTTNESTATDGVISLREALIAANTDQVFGDAAAGSDSDIITFAAGLSGQSITLSLGELAINTAQAITINGDIDGNGAADITIDRETGMGSDFRIFTNNGTLTLNDLIIRDGAATDNGGAVFSTFALTTNNVTFSDNIATTNGGAIYSTGTLTLTDTMFDSNEAEGENVGEGGGGIFNAGGTVTITDSTFDSNRAAGILGSGGAVFSSGGTLGVDDVVFTMNNANRAGGALEGTNGTIITSQYSTYDSNSALDLPGNGGAAHISDAGTTFNSTSDVFDSNNANRDGGGLWVGATSIATIDTGDFIDNALTGDGAGVGGAIYVMDGGDLNVTNTAFFGNNASTGQVIGSGAAAMGTGNIEITSSTPQDGEVYGGSQDDFLEGDATANVLIGGAGRDVLNGLAGNDTMTGGTGDDVYSVTETGDIVTELQNEGFDVIYNSVDYILPNHVEHMVLIDTGNGTGNGLDNYMFGNDLSNTLHGEGGHDILCGFEGADTLYGGEGEDILDGGTGEDTMVGGTQNDSYRVDSLGDSVIENTGEGLDVVYSSIDGYTLADDVEFLILDGVANGTGNDGDNAIFGNDLDNRLNGGAGLDALYGFGGNDTFVLNAADNGTSEPQQIIVGFEGAGVTGGDTLEFGGYGEGATVVQVSTQSYQVRDANNDTQAQFWLYQGNGVLTADDYMFV
ncbi:calcium-binding protein [Ahrensia sp. R2A130]|uniref:calcium-binding protein n=1 Tax=Ahrensia sp. R2A130 TaxID=744979 RepID=UPI0001E08440|nr:calcium-binding protein [Ahrensia sp. R2A130]EFL88091.1 hemolysin-type calcium-binding region [Ahrensia sp. R2A130]